MTGPDNPEQRSLATVSRVHSGLAPCIHLRQGGGSQLGLGSPGLWISLEGGVEEEVLPDFQIIIETLPLGYKA